MISYMDIDGFQLHPGTVNLPARVGIYSIQGLGTAPLRQAVYDRAASHGQTNISQFFSARPITIAGRVLGNSNDDVAVTLATLQGMFVPGVDQVLRFKRGDGIVLGMERCFVRLVNFDAELKPRQPFLVDWTAQLLAGDPRIYSDALKSGTYDPTTAISGGGVTFPLTFPLTFGASVSELSVTNAGTFETPPKFTITGPVINPVIDNDSTVKSIYISYSMGVSDVIVVDVATNSCLLNGASRPDLIDAANTAWFSLAKGQNLLRLRGSGMAAGQTSLTVQFRDARI